MNNVNPLILCDKDQADIYNGENYYRYHPEIEITIKKIKDRVILAWNGNTYYMISFWIHGRSGDRIKIKGGRLGWKQI